MEFFVEELAGDSLAKWLIMAKKKLEKTVHGTKT